MADESDGRILRQLIFDVGKLGVLVQTNQLENCSLGGHQSGLLLDLGLFFDLRQPLLLSFVILLPRGKQFD